MSIKTAIENARERVNAVYDKCSEKGATIPDTKNIANLPDTIDTISTGGGGDVVYAVNSAVSEPVEAGEKVIVDKMTTQEGSVEFTSDYAYFYPVYFIKDNTFGSSTYFYKVSQEPLAVTSISGYNLPVFNDFSNNLFALYKIDQNHYIYHENTTLYYYNKGTDKIAQDNSLDSNTQYAYRLNGLGKSTNRFAYALISGASSYIHLYRLDDTTAGPKSVLVASSESFSPNYSSETAFIGYYGGKIFLLTSYYTPNKKPATIAYSVDEDTGIVDIENPIINEGASSINTYPKIYPLSDRVCLALSYSPLVAFLITVNGDGTTSSKDITSSFTSEQIKYFYYRYWHFNPDINSLLYYDESNKVIYDYRYSEENNEIYLSNTIDVSSFPRSTYNECSNMSELGYFVMFRNTYTSGQYTYYKLFSTQTAVHDFKALPATSSNFTDTALTGFTTGEVDEEGKIGVSTVLPPTIEVTVQTDVDATLKVEGGI